MKKLVAFLLMLGLVMTLLAGCGGQQAAPQKTEEPTKAAETQKPAETQKAEPAAKPKLGLVMIDLNHPFYAAMMEAGKKAEADFGVEGIWKSAEGSLEKEIAIIENFIQQKVDCILIDPIDAKGVLPAVNKAIDAGIPVVTMGNFVDAGKNVNTLYNDFGDSKTIARVMGNYLGGKGNVVLLVGTPGNYCSDQREAGFKEGLQEFPDIKLLSTQPMDWDPTKAMKVVENWLTTYPDIDAMFCVSDACTFAAIEALKAAGKLEDIAVFSYDGEIEASEKVKAGEIKLDLLTGAKRVGYWNVREGAKLAKGESLANKVYLPTHFIAKDDVINLMKEKGLDKDISIIGPDQAIKQFDAYQEELGPKK